MRRKSADQPRVGERVNEFQLLRAVGRGSVSTVYTAVDTGDPDRRRVALKLLHPDLAVRAEAHSMLYDEACVLRRIDHPNVVRVVSRGTWLGIPYIALEAVDGRTYASVLNSVGHLGWQLDPGFHCLVLAQAAAGLHAAHQATEPSGSPLCVVHRDFKPSNLIVGYDGAVKVIDFSVVHARKRQSRTRVGIVKGTPSYLSPEQISRPQSVDFRADIWALGVVAWEAFAGRRLFASRVYARAVSKIMLGEIPNLAEVAPRVPNAVSDLVMRCLRRDPAARPESADEISRRLFSAADALGYTHVSHVGEELARWVDASHAEALPEGALSPADDDTTGLFIPIDVDVATA
ncbi:MAG: serine/threonine-protein kinase [Polyangiaceae bacterium]